MKKNLKQRIYVSIRNNKKCLFSTDTITHPFWYFWHKRKKGIGGSVYFPGHERASSVCVCQGGTGGLRRPVEADLPQEPVKQTFFKLKLTELHVWARAGPTCDDMQSTFWCNEAIKQPSR